MKLKDLHKANTPDGADDYVEVVDGNGWKKYPNSKMQSFRHPLHGIITIDSHGDWEHKPHNSEPDDGFGGTTTATLKAHLARLKD